jgi:hypothetical protein
MSTLVRTRRTSLMMLILSLVACVVSVPSAAFALEEADISYSLDGITWSSTPPESVIPAGWIPVPSSSRTGTLHLRAERPGLTLVALFAGSARSNSPSLLAGTSVMGAGGAPVTISESPTCSALAPQVALREGETVTIPLTVSLDAGLTDGENAALSFDMLLALSDTASIPLSNGCPVDPTLIPLFPGTTPQAVGEPLLRTGSEIPFLLILAGLAAITAGVVSGVRGIRRNHPPQRT